MKKIILLVLASIVFCISVATADSGDITADISVSQVDMVKIESLWIDAYDKKAIVTYRRYYDGARVEGQHGKVEVEFVGNEFTYIAGVIDANALKANLTTAVKAKLGIE